MLEYNSFCFSFCIHSNMVRWADNVDPPFWLGPSFYFWLPLWLNQTPRVANLNVDSGCILQVYSSSFSDTDDVFLDCSAGTLDMVSLGEIAFWSLEGGDTLSYPEGNDPLGTFPVTCDMCVALSQMHGMCSPIIPPTLSVLLTITLGSVLVGHGEKRPS